MPDAAAARDRELLLTRLAEKLLDYPAVILSGARLADELGVSQSTVWAGMQELRGHGVRLEGHRGTGYRLQSVPDLLLPGVVTPLLATQAFGRRIHHAFRTDSTQTTALRAAAAAGRGRAVEGELFVAEAQSAGRGRHGHAWESAAAAGIYASLVLRPPGPPSGLLPLTLLAGLAFADAVREAAGVEPELRWPNDLLLGGRKFCGLLLEMSGEATRIHHAVLGFGVNVARRRFEGELAATATSLDAHAARPVSRARLLAAALGALERRYLAWRTEGPGATLWEFETRSRYARGLAVRVGELEGETAGLDASGFLLLRLPGGHLHTILSGDVRPRDEKTEKHS